MSIAPNGIVYASAVCSKLQLLPLSHCIFLSSKELIIQCVMVRKLTNVNDLFRLSTAMKSCWLHNSVLFAQVNTKMRRFWCTKKKPHRWYPCIPKIAYILLLLPE